MATEIPIEVSNTLMGAVVAFIVWLIRLESKVKTAEKDQAKIEKEYSNLKTKHDALSEKIVDRLTSIEKHLAKIQGRLSIHDNAET